MCVREHLDAGGPRPSALVAVGKAAVPMAAAAVEALGRPPAGVVVAPHAVARDVGGLRSIGAGHPVPDGGSLEAGDAVEALARALGEGDLLLVLLSGGASALLCAPVAGLTLDDLAATNEALLASGADIAGTNAVRKHLSRLKGGRLAALAAPARVRALLLSDVVGDDPATIGSGPTAPDPSTFGDALVVLRDRGVLEHVPRAVRAHLEAGASGAREETPKPKDRVFERVEHGIVGSSARSLDAAAAEAERRGLRVVRREQPVVGEAREAAGDLARRARALLGEGDAGVHLSGGETTVTLRGDGTGGRNQELALAFALAMEGAEGPPWVLVSAGMDGIDGPTDAAGAVVDGGTLGRARRAGLDPEQALADNDSHTLLEAAGDLLRTGPTGTNVADVQILVWG